MIEKTRLIAIKDFESQGKSTTLWLLLFTLVKEQKATLIHLRNLNTCEDMSALPENIPAGYDMIDFEAEVKWNGKLIIINSRGDYADYLVDDVKNALVKEPDYAINAIHCRERNHTIWNCYNAAFPNTEYKRVLFWSEHTDDFDSKLEVKNATVEAILKYMS